MITHKRPSDNMQIRPMRFARGSWSFHMAGIGWTKRNRSVTRLKMNFEGS
jgi:hypothetical protein